MALACGSQAQSHNRWDGRVLTERNHEDCYTMCAWLIPGGLAALKVLIRACSHGNGQARKALKLTASTLFVSMPGFQ